MFSIMAILCWLVLLEGKNNQLCVSRVTLVLAEGRNWNLNWTPAKPGHFCWLRCVWWAAALGNPALLSHSQAQGNPSCSIPAQNPGTALPGWEDFTGASKMGGADGLAAGVTVKAGLLILQRPLFYKSSTLQPFGLLLIALGFVFPADFL